MEKPLRNDNFSVEPINPNNTVKTKHETWTAHRNCKEVPVVRKQHEQGDKVNH